MEKQKPKWMPQSQPQWKAFLSPAFETLFGGACGGGKSDLLLGLARYQHKKSLLLRREIPDLERTLVIRSTEFFGDKDRYNSTRRVWNIDGRRIEFGHMEMASDVDQYQSAQYDFIGFDELTQFQQFQYEYMLSRARSVNPGQRVRIVSCTNPGGEGNDWVMQRWAAWLDDTYAKPAQSGEVRYFKRNKEGADVETNKDDPKGMGRTFIASLVADNPFLDEGYKDRLALLPEPYRSQLLFGDWKIGFYEDAYQVIPRTWIKLAQMRWESNPPTDENKVILPITCVGVDVARGGADKTVLAKRRGYWIDNLVKVDGKLTPDGQTVSTLIAQEIEDSSANVDIIGVGASAYDISRDRGMKVKAVNFSNGTEARDKSGQLKFMNVRAEAYWNMRELLDPSNPNKVALPPDPELFADLAAPMWSMQTGGIKIESKDDIRKRLGRSPDCADAVVLAFYEDVTWLIT